MIDFSCITSLPGTALSESLAEKSRCLGRLASINVDIKRIGIQLSQLFLTYTLASLDKLWEYIG